MEIPAHTLQPPIRHMSSLFSRLRNLQINSRAARSIMRLYYRENSVYTIPMGPLRGLKMRYDPTINFHVILGLWDVSIFRLLDQVLVKSGLLKPDSIICEGGANVGTYTMYFSRRVPGGKVYSFEPTPAAFSRTMDFMSLNNITNVVLEPQALSGAVGTTRFFLGLHHATSSIFEESASRGEGTRGSIEVPTNSLDAYFFGETKRAAPHLIKLDIEGAGVYALKSCSRCVEAIRPFILIESHNPDEDRAISELIVGAEYDAFRVNDNRWVTAPHDTFPAKQGVWGTLLLCPREKYAAVAAAIPA